MSLLTIVPLSLSEANELVRRWHRHHKPVIGHKFSIGVADDEERVCGAAIVSRPPSRESDDGWTLCVSRLVTDGTKNACSALYAAAWRVSRAMGYRRLITYTLPSEGGVSLRAAGWKLIGTTREQPRWHKRKGRPQVEKHVGQKLIWEA